MSNVALYLKAAAVPVRQTVLTGPEDASGYPNFLPATSVNLDLMTQGISTSTPLIVTSANGWNENGPVNDRAKITSNITWAGLTASVTNYLYLLINNGLATPLSTIVPPVYQFGVTPSITANTFTFNIQQMKGHYGNGSAAPQANIVFVGKAIAGVSSITSTIAYAYQGKYDSGWTNTLPAVATLTSKNHNIGTDYVDRQFIAQCITVNNGYDVGDNITVGDNGGNGTDVPQVPVTRLTVGITSAASGFSIYNKTTGAGVGLGGGHTGWKWKFTAKRNDW